MNRLACDEPTSRTVDVEQFCSWSACRISSRSSARDDLRVHLVGLGREPERHPQEVLDQRQRVVRVQERLADRLLVRVGRDGRQLGQQPDRRQLDLLLVQRVHRVRVVRGQRVDRAGQHRHRVRVAREPVEEPLEVLVEQRVPLDLGGELLQLIGRRQLAVDQQVADLDERRLLRQLLDRVAAVAQDACVAVDVADRALRRRRVDEATVERGVAGLGQQRTQRDAVGSLGRLRRSPGRSRPPGNGGWRARHWIGYRPRESLRRAVNAEVCTTKGSPIQAAVPARGQAVG